MKMRFHFFSVVLAGVLMLGLAGCRAGQEATVAPTVAAETETAATQPMAATQPVAETEAVAPTVDSEATMEEVTATGVAHGEPPYNDTWTPGDKLGVGTAYTYDQGGNGEPSPSRVWFTITDGAVTDILYPDVGRASVDELSLLVAGEGGVVHEISPEGTLVSEVAYLDPRALAYRVTTRDPQGGWEAVKEVVTDPEADSLITRWTFTDLDPDTQSDPYAYFVPHLGGSGRRDTLRLEEGAVIAGDETGPVYAVVLMDPAPEKASVGFLQSSDGLTDLEDGRMDWTYSSLPETNYGAATLALPVGEPVTLVVGFGESEAAARAAAEATLMRGFDAVAEAYIQGWNGYLDGLQGPESDGPEEQAALYWVSAMLLKAHEDKTFHGAGVASLSAPWGQCLFDESFREQGYRYVWPRDLYHVAMAYLALGDVESAETTLAYLDDVLQLRSGSFPQNAYLDGTVRWTSIQMDEIADPILLAWALGAQERYESLVKPAAEFIAGRGPTTLQERWEENGGYSPHSIAAQVVGLLAAAEMAETAGEPEVAGEWRSLAEEWAGQIEAWTFTTNGPLGDGRYFLRLSPDGDPNAEASIQIANGGGLHPLQEVIDVSLFELVRLGLRSPQAEAVVESIPEVDEALMVETPNGPAWQRYTYDGYGESEPGRCAPGQGHYWPLFNGERGNYAVAAGDLEQAQNMLAAMQRFANEGWMLPEQVFADTGEGTGSATPLAWAHAEYIILARSIQEGRVVDMPQVALDHFSAP